MDHEQPVAGAPAALPDQRRKALDAAVTRDVSNGATLVHRAEFEAVMSLGGGIGHWVGVLLTGGLWLLGYPTWKAKRYTLAVNEEGRVWRHLPTGQWERAD